MSLLAPLFLAGFLAIALPIWLHRLQTQSSVRQKFSSAMLLESSEQRVHVQRKLKYFVLLALRIALFLLLALAFAKPFLLRSPAAGAENAAGSLLVVVDTSASMGREGVFSQAQNEARRTIDEADLDTAIQLLSADATLRLVTDLSSDKNAHRAALANLEVTAMRLDYGDAMEAIGRLATSLPPPVRLHFMSDFQSSAMPVRFSDLVLSGIAEFVPHVVGTGYPLNWSVEFMRETADGLDVGVSAYGDNERVAELELLVNETVIESRALNGLGRQTISFSGAEYTEGDNRVAARIESDDDLQADNQWFHVVERNPPTTVPLITYNPGGLPVTYLTAALASAGENQYNVQTMLAGQFDARVLSRYRWLVIDDIGSLDDQLSAALTTFLQDGGNLLAFAGDRAAALETIPLTGHRHISGNVTTVSNRFLSIGQIDTDHQALTNSDGWHSVNVSRSMPVAEVDGDQVLVRLENGEPFLVEQRIGAGRLLLVLGGLDNQWSDLPVRPVFVSFIVDAARYLSGINEIAKIYTAGASLPLALTGGASGQVVDPDGNSVLSLADTTREQQIRLNKTGFYEVYTPQGEMLVAVNIDPLESDLRAISQDVLDRWREASDGQPSVGNVPVFTPAQVAELTAESRLELWRWVLLLAALIMIGESLLGNSYLAPRRTERG